MNVNDGLRNTLDFLMIYKLISTLDSLRNTLDFLIMNVKWTEKFPWFLRCYENEIRNTLDLLIMNVNEVKNSLDFLDDMQSFWGFKELGTTALGWR